jgi:predicted  nucleic acid-binding Zn-ribbon protein
VTLLAALATFIAGGGLVKALEAWRRYRKDRGVERRDQIADLQAEVHELRASVDRLNAKLEVVLHERVALREEAGMLRVANAGLAQNLADALADVEAAHADRDAWRERAQTAEAWLLTVRVKSGDA